MGERDCVRGRERERVREGGRKKKRDGGRGRFLIADHNHKERERDSGFRVWNAHQRSTDDDGRLRQSLTRAIT